jgi:hypothetical protein
MGFAKVGFALAHWSNLPNSLYPSQNSRKTNTLSPYHPVFARVNVKRSRAWHIRFYELYERLFLVHLPKSERHLAFRTTCESCSAFNKHKTLGDVANKSVLVGHFWTVAFSYFGMRCVLKLRR